MSNLTYWMLCWNEKLNGCKCISCLPLWTHGLLGAVALCCCPVLWESITAHIASPGEDKNSKFKVWFLLNVHCFCTIVKLKNHKSNRHKSGTVCILDVHVIIERLILPHLQNIQPELVQWKISGTVLRILEYTHNEHGIGIMLPIF